VPLPTNPSSQLSLIFRRDRREAVFLFAQAALVNVGFCPTEKTSRLEAASAISGSADQICSG